MGWVGRCSDPDNITTLGQYWQRKATVVLAYQLWLYVGSDCKAVAWNANVGPMLVVRRQPVYVSSLVCQPWENFGPSWKCYMTTTRGLIRK